ncbi:MAG: hypothetical protein ABIK93_03815 [candidate division WOR-3 bacterium]
MSSRLKHFWLKVDIKEHLGGLVVGALLAVVIAAYLYPLAWNQLDQVTKRISDLSFLQLSDWSSGVFGILRLENLVKEKI